MSRIAMSLTAVAVLALLLSSGLMFPPQAASKPAGAVLPEKDDDSPLAKIGRRADVPAMADGKTKATLSEALETLKKIFKVRFTINEKAFAYEDVSTKALLDSPITAEGPIAAAENTRLDTALEGILARCPSSSGATFLVRRDSIEITTRKFAHAEVWGESLNTPCLPIVHVRIETQPLEEALARLAEEADFSIIVDKRIGDKAKAPVGGRFLNTPLDTAVQMLTEMAEVRAVHRDNVLFVTLRGMANEMEKRLQAEAARAEKGGEAMGGIAGLGIGGAGLGGIAGIGGGPPGGGLGGAPGIPPGAGAFGLGAGLAGIGGLNGGGFAGIGGLNGGGFGGGNLGGLMDPASSGARPYRKGGDRRGLDKEGVAAGAM